MSDEIKLSPAAEEMLIRISRGEGPQIDGGILDPAIVELLEAGMIGYPIPPKLDS